MLNEFAFKLNGISLENMLQLDDETINEASLNNFIYAWCSDDNTLALGGAINRKFAIKRNDEGNMAALGVYRKNGQLTFADDATNNTSGSGSEIIEGQYILAIPNPGSIPPSQWEIQSSLPNSTFDVFADDHLFCRGIVFSMDDIK